MSSPNMQTLHCSCCCIETQGLTQHVFEQRQASWKGWGFRGRQQSIWQRSCTACGLAVIARSCRGRTKVLSSSPGGTLLKGSSLTFGGGEQRSCDRSSLSTMTWQTTGSNGCSFEPHRTAQKGSWTSAACKERQTEPSSAAGVSGLSTSHGQAGHSQLQR